MFLVASIAETLPSYYTDKMKGEYHDKYKNTFIIKT